MADRAGVEREEVGRLAQADAAHVVDGVPKGDVDVVEEGTTCADEVVLALEPESVEGGDVEVAQQLLASGVEAEGPGVCVGAVPRGSLEGRLFRTAAGFFVVGLGEDELGGAVAGKGVHELFGGIERFHRELAGREVEKGEAAACHGGDVAVGVRV